ncbi:MAG: hypothetical protein HY22_00415 [[Candidatus Thermochlorobacteriaceae] bacterium GBChlB]|nr:MAG: hypothetical protein HY22_00415 [[Candidatus Thermochlorobacteriaceae] bacterium GBChlB]
MQVSLCAYSRSKFKSTECGEYSKRCFGEGNFMRKKFEPIGVYYQGLVSVQVVKAGLNAARDLIEMLEGRPKKS